MDKLFKQCVWTPIVSAAFFACATRPVAVTTTPGQPVPETGKTAVNAPTPLPPATPVTGRWHFTYTPGVYKYSIVTAANIAVQSDTTAIQSLPTASEQATLTVKPNGDIEVTDPPPSTSITCDTLAALVTRAQQLLPKLPGQIVTDSTWNDSSVRTGCHAMIPTTVKASYTYSVLSDTLFGGVHTVHVKRIEALTAQGMGNEGQHQISLAANGTGTTNFYLDVTSGMLLGSSTRQVTKLDITTSGQTSHFLQHVTENVTLLKVP